MSLGEKIGRLRRAHNLSQEELAERLRVSRQAVAKWEGGEALPELNHVVALARFFTVSLDSLLKEEEPCGPGSTNGTFDADPILAFLCRAKVRTYAGKGAEVESSRPASHDLHYVEGDLVYIDSFLGGEQFSGEEAVWRGGVPLWAMNYTGRTLSERFSGDFLKEALSRVEPTLPYRGPAVYHDKEYVYHCLVNGSFEWFSGAEEILYGTEKVYECVFHGGKVR